jgi:WD40 repeat protein
MSTFRPFGVLLVFLGLAVGGALAAPAPFAKDGATGWRSVRRLGRLGHYQRLLAISPDGRQLLLNGRSTGLLVYDLAQGKVVRQFPTTESLQDAAVSPDGKTLATAEWRDGVKLRDYRTLKILNTVKGSGNLAASQVRFSRDSKRLVVHSWWGPHVQFWVYDVAARKELGWPAFRRPDTSNLLVRECLKGNNPWLFSVEQHYDPDRGLYHRHRAWLTDPATGKRTPTVELHAHDLCQFDVRSDGAQAIVMQPGEAPRVIDLTTGKTLQTLAGHARWVTAAAFSPDGRFIATASGMTEDCHARCYTTRSPPPEAGTEVLLRHAASGRVVARLKDAEEPPDFASVGFSPNGRYLYAVTRDRELWLWGDLPPIAAKPDPFPRSIELRKTP